MKVDFENGLGHLSVLDKFTNEHYCYIFEPASLIRWYPLNMNYSYCHSYKENVVYLSLDSKGGHTSYGINSKKQWRVHGNTFNGKGILNMNTWQCDRVYLDNYMICQYLMETYHLATFLNPKNTEARRKDILYVLTRITGISIEISHRYEKKAHPQCDLDGYFEIALREASLREQKLYRMMGYAYQMLRIMQKEARSGLIA